MTPMHMQFGLGKTALIQAFVAGYYRVPASEMFSDTKSWESSRPRQIAMYLTRELTALSFPQIGVKFNRDHSTIVHAIRAVKDRIACNEQVAADVEILRQRLSA